MKGRKITNAVQQLDVEAQPGVYTSAAPEADGANITGSFPRKGFSTASSQDEIKRAKLQLVESGTNGQTPFGQATLTDSDIRWLEQKRQSEAYANLDAWIGKNFHNASAAQRKWLQETFPDYYDSREQLMLERAKLALRIKLLMLRGPKNEKDLMLEWALQTGQIELEEGWDKIGNFLPAGADLTAQLSQNRFKQGLLSPARYKINSTRKTNAGAEANPFRVNTGTNPPWQGGTANMVGFSPNANPYPEFLKSVLMGQIN